MKGKTKTKAQYKTSSSAKSEKKRSETMPDDNQQERLLETLLHPERGSPERKELRKQLEALFQLRLRPGSVEREIRSRRLPQ